MSTDKKSEHCSICPHHCKALLDKPGFCRVRKYNINGWENTGWGKASALSVDPVEKKPFYHYYPGYEIFSVGFWGCNMRCPFCQNWQISQNMENISQEIIPPAKILEMMEQKGMKLLAFTYNEPLIHYDYILETAEMAASKEIKISIVSNGMLNPELADRLLPYLDACNIDLKSFNAASYKRLGGDLDSVLTFIEKASRNCHLELTTLIVPGFNDKDKEMEELASFVSSLPGEGILHISAYYPAYKYNEAATTDKCLERMLAIARKHLYWIYPGNSPLPGDSICKTCGSTLIHRRGYHISAGGLRGGNCRHCGQPQPFITGD